MLIDLVVSIYQLLATCNLSLVAQRFYLTRHLLLVTGHL